MEIWIPIIAIISTFGSASFVTYLFFKTRHRERMALIENDANARIFSRAEAISDNLKWGMFLVAIGLALFLGYSLEQSTNMDEVAYFAPILILGGGALISFYIISKRSADQIDQV